MAAWSVLAAVTLFVLWQLYPSLIVRDTTPAEGDLAGHLHVGRHLRYHLLPQWRLSGWSQDWFTGVPMLMFYFPLASLLVTLASFVLPYNVALKLVVAMGPVALPWCAYAFGRLNRCDRLTSACFGVSMVPLLLHSPLFFDGGSIAATAGGEYAYGLAFAFGLLVVGLARSGLRTGRRRALTAGLLGAVIVLHLVVVVMVVVAIVISTVLRPTWARLRWTGAVLVTAGLVAGFWLVPFVLRTRMTAGRFVAKRLQLAEGLFPVEMVPILLLAFVGVVAMLAGDPEDRDRLAPFLMVMVVLSGVLFAVVPGGRVPNGRFLPFWFLWLCLTAGYGLSQLARFVDKLRRERARGRSLGVPALGRLVAPAVAVAALVPLFDTRDWNGLLARTQRFALMPETAKTRFGGYERGVLRAESRDFIDTMRRVARTHGCGRVNAEFALGTFSEVALGLEWRLPYWTDGCLTTTHGYFLDASATSPYVTLVNAPFSSAAPNEDSGEALDITKGVAGLRSLGVRYFVASHPKTVAAADASPDLRSVAQTKSYTGPYSEVYGRAFWKVYELSGVELAVPLRHLPVVVSGIDRSRGTWDRATAKWFDAGDLEEATVAASGPAGWPRRGRVSDDLPRRPVATATVSRVRITHDLVSFDVSRTGVPVLVKVSYFPNWRATGADGPWRVLPNQMVVVPTARTVTLRYGRTFVDHLGWLATVAGIGGVVFLARRGPVDMPRPLEPTRDRKPPSGSRPSPKRKKRGR